MAQDFVESEPEPKSRLNRYDLSDIEEVVDGEDGKEASSGRLMLDNLRKSLEQV